MKYVTLLLLLLSSIASAEFTVPALPNPVNDYANVLTPAGKEEIATKIIEFKKETGVQLGVLLVSTLDGTNIEVAAQEVAQKWKLGKKDENKGLLLMVAINDRKSRIEVGYGMEHIMTDATTKDILVSMRADLKSKRFDSAINLGVTSIFSTVKNFKEEVTPSAQPKTEEESGVPTFLLILFVAIGSFLVYLVGRKKKTKEKSSPRIYHEDPPTESRTTSRTTRSSAKSRSSESSYVPVVVPSRSRSDDSGSSWGSSSSSSDSSSSSSGSDWGGGGGDFGGGGSSDSW